MTRILTPLKRSRFAGLMALTLLAATMASARAGVEFPGPPPGLAQSSQPDAATYTLENAVIGASWQVADGHLAAVKLVNKLTGESFDQSGTELFRLGLAEQPVLRPQRAGLLVGIRLDPDRVVALSSRDGADWTEIASFPRAEFAGEPKLARLGKMNLKAQAKSYSDPGIAGHCRIREISLAPGREFSLNVRANEAQTEEFPFPAGTNFVSCRIDKETDAGMSWGPALALVWEEGEKFLLVGIREKEPIFNVSTAAGEEMIGKKLDNYPAMDAPASGFQLVGTPQFAALPADADGVRVAQRIAGRQLTAELVSPGGLHVQWRAELRDGSSYVRQTITLSSPDKKIPLYAVELGDVRVPGVKTVGSVPGCPVAGGGMYFGLEMPGTQNAVTPAGARTGLPCKLVVAPDQSYEFGAVAGVAPAGQLRRAFLYYVERERARPSRPFLHYNCWYDLGFSVDAPRMLDVAKQFHTEMEEKRGVKIQSYLIDDGWDTPGNGLWQENRKRFPGGYAALKKQMAAFDANLSIWISPLGGYGGREERTATAQKMGLIPPGAQLDFAYPAYKNWFQNRCLELMREGGVNAFKWDKAGEGVGPHFMALLDVAKHLRRENPALFINVTVGTWPSPFWLNHVDSTWRNGSADVGWAGVGDDREQWITFRDGWCRKLFVQKSPLYPLNSMMMHGLVNGRNFQGERVAKAGPHLRHEARSYFAVGTSLQELYLTPSLMTPEAWDDVAAAAKWAQANADVLVDSHWVGGDPLKLQPYGYAAWNPHKATLMVRNPSDQAQDIALEAGTVFDLPPGHARSVAYSLTSPYADQRVQKLSLTVGQSQTVHLEPFEVLVFDAAAAD